MSEATSYIFLYDLYGLKLNTKITKSFGKLRMTAQSFTKIQQFENLKMEQFENVCLVVGCQLLVVGFQGLVYSILSVLDMSEATFLYFLI